MQSLVQAQALAREAVFARAREDFNYFMQTVVQDEYGRPIRQAAHHRVWVAHMEACWAAKKHAAIFAPWAHGKCQSFDSKVQLAGGLEMPIGELAALGTDVQVLAWDDRTFEWCPALGRAFANGRHRLRRFTLDSGRHVEVTDEHPFYQVKGWVAAKDLCLNDQVAVARRLPDMGRLHLREGEASLLGYMNGDGGVTTGATFTKEDALVRADVARCAALLGFKSHLVKQTTRCSTLCLSNGVRNWLRQHGLFGKKSTAKTTPIALWTAPLHQIAEYLGAYFSCDGGVSSASRTIDFYSTSKPLLIDAQSLLLRFGITSVLARKRGKYRGEVHWSWRLTISGNEALHRFRDCIPLVGSKHAALQALDLSRVQYHANRDLVPVEFRSMLTRSAPWHRRNSGVVTDQVVVFGLTRGNVRRAALAEGNADVLRLVHDNVSWERIIAIEDLGEQETYGLEVDGIQTYVSGGVIVHNTSQLVGRVAWELGRNPNLRIKIISNTDENAGDRVMAVSRLILSKRYRAVFPHIIPARKEKHLPTKWTQHEIRIEKSGSSIDPSVESYGVLGSGTGSRADLEIYDDIVDQKNAIDEPRLRPKIVYDFDRVWMSRLEPDGRAMLIGSLWHQADCHHAILQREAWCSLRQYVSGDFTRLDQEVYGIFEGYPIPRMYPALRVAA